MKELLSKKGPLSDIKNIDEDYHLLQEQLASMTDVLLNNLFETLQQITGENKPPLWERFYYGSNGLETI